MGANGKRERTDGVERDDDDRHRNDGCRVRADVFKQRPIPEAAEHANDMKITEARPWLKTIGMHLCIMAIGALCFYQGYRSASGLSRCRHEGRLDRIGPTWRINVSLWTGDKATELGICKSCGTITDAVQKGDGWMTHFPIAGTPNGAPARFDGKVTITNEPAKAANGDTLL